MMWGEEDKDAAIFYHALESGKEYRVKWISSQYSDKYNIYPDDIVLLNKKEVAFMDSAVELTKLRSSLGFVGNYSPIEMSYAFVSVCEIDNTKATCKCEVRTLVMMGCACGAFQKGDR